MFIDAKLAGALLFSAVLYLIQVGGHPAEISCCVCINANESKVHKFPIAAFSALSL